MIKTRYFIAGFFIFLYLLLYKRRLIIKLYHTFESKNGFDLNKIDFNRGIFTLKPWWVGREEYKQYSAFHPNEFGDKVVELDIDDSMKTFVGDGQLEVLEDFFPESENTKKVIDKFEMGTIEREDWQKLDTFIGKFLKRKGYKLIHYTDESMYGDVWVILDKSAIKNVRYEND